MPRTSEYLQRCLDEPSGEAIPPEVQHKATNPSALWDWIDALLLHQFTGLHYAPESDYSFVEKEKGTIAGHLDDALCRAFVREVPNMVRRILTFDRVLTSQPHNETVHVYFEQAMRCYVQGLPAAAVAIARACMEHALRDTIPIPRTTSLDLQGLITAAERSKLLDGAHLHIAKDVQRIGNKVLHRDNCTDSEALDSIVKVRAVVEALYGSAAE
jgi:hypothetical protein